jgi:hypothetical protein
MVGGFRGTFFSAFFTGEMVENKNAQAIIAIVMMSFFMAQFVW